MPRQPQQNAHVVSGDTAYIDVSTRKHPDTWTLVDVVDLPKVLDGRGRWHAHEIGRCATLYVDRFCNLGNGRGYAQRLHRVLVGLDGVRSKIVDHADGDGLNNRRVNLRVTSYGRNKSNSVKRSACSSRFKGVHAMNGKWRAAIRCDHNRFFLGDFSTEEAAARAYDDAARRLFGEFACLNFGQREDVQR
jgi:hypothetical protein